MAAPALNRDAGALPGEPALRAFAAVAAQLLAERPPRHAGARAVARRAGAGLQHLDHRDYRPGDEVRHIDWRQTARRRLPVLRRFEAETQGDWTLVLDASSSMAFGDGAKWRGALQITAAMGYALLQMGHRVGLLLVADRVLAECPRGRGRTHYAALARLLQAWQPAPRGQRSGLGACAPHLQGAGTAFVLSDFLADGDIARELGALRQRCTGLHALQVGDAAETRLPQAGECELVDVESGARLAVQAGAQVEALAAAHRAETTARLRGWCARSGVAFTDWDLAMPWQHTLLGHLERARSHC
jgi:uncharacterized protein (DUF58 family)